MKANKPPSPPRWATRLLAWYCAPHLLEEIQGDLQEEFDYQVIHTGVARARLDYIRNVLEFIKPFALKRKKSPVTSSNIMIKSYFKIGWRNLMKNKGYSTINILGLGLGIACCLMIFMYVDYEMSFDNYHSKGDQIYRVIHGWKEDDNAKGNSTDSYWVWGNAPIGRSLADNFPEIDKVVQFSGRSDILLTHGDTKFQEEGIFFMDSTVFDVFDWKLVKGNPKTALSAPFSVVLTETTARKYFGDEDPLGKLLKGSESAGRSDAGEYQVTGVMEDVPANSHFKFNALLSMSTFRNSIPDIFDAWGYVDFYTYFLVNEQFDRAKFEAKIPEFVNRHKEDPTTDKYTIAIEPLRDVYLRTAAQRQPGETGSLPNLYVFSIIGIFILAIALINFMNLSTARSMERGKEVGIRKSVGADRKSLIVQFLGESLIIVSLSVIVALFITTVALPGMNDISGRMLNLQHFITPQYIALLIGISLVIGIVAGSYPSFVLSAFNPVKVLKGMSKSGKAGVNIRRGLVIFQFTLSIALIGGTVVVYFQMGHILNKDLGFDKERMLVLDYNYDQDVNTQREVLKTEMEALPEVQSVAYSRSVPGSYFPNAFTEIQTPDGEIKGMAQPIFQVGIDFVNHFGLELVAGRSYSRDHPSDTIGGLVINEAAARQYGYTNPADIVGKKYSQWGRKGEVIGVVKDFNYISLHRDIEPLTLPYEPFASRYMSLKIKSSNMASTVEAVQKIWSALAPHRPFLYSFLDDDFNRQYQKDFNFRKLFTVFSCLAIFIACLGLLGLATYTAELRTKEIGIRKVLGANIRNIVTLLSKDFIILITISMFIATPIAWYSMNQWLAGFAYHVDIHFWIFILAGLVALSIAVLTISYQAIKAALVNPVKSLKSE